MDTIAFKTIGIGVTFSPNLEANINEAARLALFLGGRLVLIHVGESSDEKLNTFLSFLNPFTVIERRSMRSFKKGFR